MAAALPLELRHHAGDAEAPPRQSTLATLGIRLGWPTLRRTGGLNSLMGAHLPTGDG